MFNALQRRYIGFICILSNSAECHTTVIPEYNANPSTAPQTLSESHISMGSNSDRSRFFIDKSNHRTIDILESRADTTKLHTREENFVSGGDVLLHAENVVIINLSNSQSQKVKRPNFRSQIYSVFAINLRSSFKSNQTVLTSVASRPRSST